MMLLAVDFENLHQILRNLYQDMMPLCADMIGVAKGVAGLGALFYVAYRVWKSLASAEPIDVFPLLRSLCDWVVHSCFSYTGIGYYQCRYVARSNGSAPAFWKAR